MPVKTQVLESLKEQIAGRFIGHTWDKFWERINETQTQIGDFHINPKSLENMLNSKPESGKAYRLSSLVIIPTNEFGSGYSIDLVATHNLKAKGTINQDAVSVNLFKKIDPAEAAYFVLVLENVGFALYKV